jgi:hypothetical protein
MLDAGISRIAWPTGTVAYYWASFATNQGYLILEIKGILPLYYGG